MLLCLLHLLSVGYLNTDKYMLPAEIKDFQQILQVVQGRANSRTQKDLGEQQCEYICICIKKSSTAFLINNLGLLRSNTVSTLAYISLQQCYQQRLQREIYMWDKRVHSYSVRMANMQICQKIYYVHSLAIQIAHNSLQLSFLPVSNNEDYLYNHRFHLALPLSLSPHFFSFTPLKWETLHPTRGNSLNNYIKIPSCQSQTPGFIETKNEIGYENLEGRERFLILFGFFWL